MSHQHSHTDVQNYGKAFAIGVTLNIIYIAIEATYGLIINSLALVADSGHNLSDVLGLLLAWGASYLVQKPRTAKHTYGFKKSSVLAAFLNALFLLVAIGAITWEAIGRFIHPQPVSGLPGMVVAGIGVLVNAATAMLFFSGRRHDLNIKGAFLHMAADAAVSLGVVIVGLALVFTDNYWLDPAVSIVIALVIFGGTWGLLKESLNLALDAVPANIDKKGIENYLNSLPEVHGFHDLHIWAMSTTETALTIHIRLDNSVFPNSFIEMVSDVFEHKFSIQHTTIQIESPGEEECQQNQI